MQVYYAYENWTARSFSAHGIMVHLNKCPDVPFDDNGDRIGPMPSGANDEWHCLGEFKSAGEAMQRARALVPKGLVFRYCGHCLRGIE